VANAMTGASPFQPIGGPLPTSSQWRNQGDFLSYGGGVVVGTPAAGNTGVGTINAVNYYLNGVLMLPWQEAPTDGNVYGRDGATAAWVATIGGDAPSNGTFYGRLNGAWSQSLDMGTF
jgi:hypothetical protein